MSYRLQSTKHSIDDSCLGQLCVLNARVTSAMILGSLLGQPACTDFTRDTERRAQSTYLIIEE